MLSRPVARSTRVEWSRTVVGFMLASKNFRKELRASCMELAGMDLALIEMYDAMLLRDGLMGEKLFEQANSNQWCT